MSPTEFPRSNVNIGSLRSELVDTMIQTVNVIGFKTMNIGNLN